MASGHLQKPEPPPFLSRVEQLINEVPKAHRRAKIVTGGTVEMFGRQGLELLIDTGLDGVTRQCAIIPGETTQDDPEVWIDEDTPVIGLEQNMRISANDLLTRLVNIHFYEKLKARGMEHFSVAERTKVFHIEWITYVTHVQITAPVHIFGVGLGLFTDYFVRVLTGNHVVYLEPLKNDVLDEQKVVDAIFEWEREFRVPLYPRLVAYLTERGFDVEFRDGECPEVQNYTPFISVSFGGDFYGRLSLVVGGIRYTPDEEMQFATSCDSAFLKQAELMQALAGLSFDKLRNWSLKKNLAEPEIPQEVIIGFDPV